MATKVYCVNCKHYRKRYRGERDVCAALPQSENYVRGGKLPKRWLSCGALNMCGDCWRYEEAC